MPFRIDLRFNIDSGDDEVIEDLRDFVRLAAADGFMNDHPEEMDIIRKLTSGEGITIAEFRKCNSDEFFSTMVEAATGASLHMAVEDAIAGLRSMFNHQVLMDRYGFLEHMYHLRYGGGNTGKEKQS